MDNLQNFCNYLLTKGINVVKELKEFDENLKQHIETSKNINRVCEVYTDGSCQYNGKPGVPGGVGIYSKDYIYEISTRYENATNNRMELQAIHDALVMISREDRHETKIYTDSMYSINCCTKWYKKWEINGWKTAKGDVENKEIIQKIITLLEIHNNVNLIYVKAHNGDPGNEMADTLAKAAIGIK